MSRKQWPLIINLGNSIIGVSILAMPYCFSQCGIILGFLLLVGAAWLTSVSCRLLMQSALISKRRSYEFLAQHSYGAYGKLAVELSSIGLLIGTCIAFYVVIGDLGPAIISKLLGVENTSTLRSALLILVAVVVVTPLGLLRDVQSLNNISTASICFYILLVTTVVIRAIPNLLSGVWFTKVAFWRPDGIFKCLPIFAMAYGCQTQLFLMYNALTEPSLNKIVEIVHGAVSLCTMVYLSMGFFGYVAYYHSPISGDILMNFLPSAYADVIKLGFVLSIAVSFPLVIFPCRASIQTLLFAPKSLHDNAIGGGLMRVREMHFRTITVIIIVSTLSVGIAVPQIEFILGLTGSTMGSLICFVFPTLIFLKVAPLTPDNSRNIAKFVLILGTLIFFVSTAATVMNMSNEVEATHADKAAAKVAEKVIETAKRANVDEAKDTGEKRHEPPVPLAPDDDKTVESKVKPKNGSKPVPVKQKAKSPELVNKALNVALNKSVEKTKKEMNENLQKQNKILEQLQEQQQEQKQILKEQKKLLAELKEHDKLHKVNDTASKSQNGAAQQGQPVAGAQPVQGQPVQGQPVQGQPVAGAQPVQGQPVQGQPVAEAQPVQQVEPIPKKEPTSNALNDKKSFESQNFQKREMKDAKLDAESEQDDHVVRRRKRSVDVKVAEKMANPQEDLLIDHGPESILESGMKSRAEPAVVSGDKKKK